MTIEGGCTLRYTRRASTAFSPSVRSHSCTSCRTLFRAANWANSFSKLCPAAILASDCGCARKQQIRQNDKYTRSTQPQRRAEQQNTHLLVEACQPSKLPTQLPQAHVQDQLRGLLAVGEVGQGIALAQPALQLLLVLRSARAGAVPFAARD